MKKIIIAALSMILGSFGYVIVDSTIENRVNNLELSYSVLQEQFMSHCNIAIPTVDSDETQKELDVGDFLECVNLQSQYKMLPDAFGDYYAAFYGDTFVPTSACNTETETEPTTHTWTEPTTELTTPTSTEPTTVYREEATTANYSQMNEEEVGTFNCVHYPEYYLYINNATGQIVSKEPSYQDVYDKNYSVERVDGNFYTVKYVIEGEVSPKLAGSSIYVMSRIDGNGSYCAAEWGVIERDGTFRIDYSENHYFSSESSPRTFEIIAMNIFTD